jgi:DNA replication protein DnaC
LGARALTADQRRDLLEIVDDRHEMRSVIITSQVPIEQWYEIIGDPTIADAILDRLIHNAYRIELTARASAKSRIPPPQAPELDPVKRHDNHSTRPNR